MNIHQICAGVLGSSFLPRRHPLCLSQPSHWGRCVFCFHGEPDLSFEAFEASWQPGRRIEEVVYSDSRPYVRLGSLLPANLHVQRLRCCESVYDRLLQGAVSVEEWGCFLMQQIASVQPIRFEVRELLGVDFQVYRSREADHARIRPLHEQPGDL